jgi:hypothetical protein
LIDDAIHISIMIGTIPQRDRAVKCSGQFYLIRATSPN